jgi:hypothetical protein
LVLGLDGEAFGWCGRLAGRGLKRRHTGVARRDLGLAYYQSLASPVRDNAVHSKKLNPTGVTGTASLPLEDLLSQPEAWLAAVDTYLRAIGDPLAHRG